VSACSGNGNEGENDNTFVPTFAYLRIDGDDVAARLSDGEDERTYTLPGDVQPLNALACNQEGGLIIAVGRGESLISPLVITDGNLEIARDLPAALDPTWIDGERLLVRVVDEEGPGIRIYELDEEGFSAITPALPGQSPGWIDEAGVIAVQAGPGGGFDRLGIYGISLEMAEEGSTDPESWELLSSIPIDPRQLNPSGTTFVFATAAQENQQRDIQAIEVDGTGARTIVATPREEFAPAWTPEGDLIFLRRELLEAGQDEADAGVEVIAFDFESGEETVLARATGISALAACT
jgi:hypothetical protein